MTESIMWILIPLSILGVFTSGIITNLLFWYFRKTFPWQLTITLLQQEHIALQKEVDDKDQELRSIRERLLGAIKPR